MSRLYRPSLLSEASVFLRTLGLTLIALLGLAFYLVCSHQVRQAEVRRMASQVQQAAFSDCLQYVVGSTIGSCTGRLGAQPLAPDSPSALERQVVVSR